MRIYKANLKDLEQVIEINNQFFKKRLENNIELDYMNYNQIGWAKEEIKHLYVLKEKQEVFAAMCLFLEVYRAPKEAYILTLAVREDIHKQGLGKRLIKFAIIKSKEAKKKKLGVDSLLIYETKRFYEKCGFKVNDILEDMNGNPFYRFSMKL